MFDRHLGGVNDNRQVGVYVGAGATSRNGNLAQYVAAKESANHPSDNDFNPLKLTLPCVLNDPDNLFCTSNSFGMGRSFQFCEYCTDISPAESKERKVAAKIAFVKLMKNINNAFIDYVKSIATGDLSGKNLREALSGGYKGRALFSTAGIYENAFNNKMQKKIRHLPTAIAVYFMLQLVFSDSPHLTVAHKINAIRVIFNAYGRDAIVKAFKAFNDGYQLKYDQDSREMIPRQFATPAEMNADKQKGMFLRNTKIQKIFNGIYNAAALQAGFSILLTDPRDRVVMLQVMRSFLQLEEYSVDGHAIVDLMLSFVNLDKSQQNDIFGPRASINNPLAAATASNSVVGSEVALQSIFDDSELATLTHAQLLQRARQMAYTIHTLEFNGIKAEFDRHTHENVYSQDKDPNDYYKTMMMSPDTPDSVFVAILKKHFQILAVQYHPDKGGNAELFRKLKEAYDFLIDPSNRESYAHGQRYAGKKRGLV